jgi:hypothetical protein
MASQRFMNAPRDAGGIRAREKRAHDGDPIGSRRDAGARILGVHAAQRIDRDSPGRDRSGRAQCLQAASLLAGREELGRTAVENGAHEDRIRVVLDGQTHGGVGMGGHRHPGARSAYRARLPHGPAVSPEMHPIGPDVSRETSIAVEDQRRTDVASHAPQTGREDPEADERAPLVAKLHAKPPRGKRQGHSLHAPDDPVVAEPRVGHEKDAQGQAASPVLPRALSHRPRQLVTRSRE